MEEYTKDLLDYLNRIYNSHGIAYDHISRNKRACLIRIIYCGETSSYNICEIWVEGTIQKPDNGDLVLVEFLKNEKFGLEYSLMAYDKTNLPPIIYL